MNNYDALIIGAGSVGLPLAYQLAAKGLKVAVLDELSSAGQGQNKMAIGGVRATHSDRAKITIGIKSLQFLRRMQREFGHDVAYVEGGYLFPSYESKITESLRQLLPYQQKFGLNINWVSPAEVESLAPGIRAEGLQGGTYSPNDGFISSLKYATAFHKMALDKGVEFFFNTKVMGFELDKQRIKAVKTTKGNFQGAWVINAAGGFARQVGQMVGTDLPVFPDSHEAGVTEPVKHFLKPMVVDIQSDERSDNYYFYQNKAGTVIFCITPRPPRLGVDTRSTSEFLPMVVPRLLKLYPRLRNLNIRRVWRGLYPMTPDGKPIVGFDGDVEGMFHAVGMCGQGLMLGPGLAEIIAAAIVDGEQDPEIFSDLSPYRDFSGQELLQ